MFFPPISWKFLECENLTFWVSFRLSVLSSVLGEQLVHRTYSLKEWGSVISSANVSEHYFKRNSYSIVTEKNRCVTKNMVTFIQITDSDFLKAHRVHVLLRVEWLAGWWAKPWVKKVSRKVVLGAYSWHWCQLVMISKHQDKDNLKKKPFIFCTINYFFKHWLQGFL